LEYYWNILITFLDGFRFINYNIPIIFHKNIPQGGLQKWLEKEKQVLLAA